VGVGYRPGNVGRHDGGQTQPVRRFDPRANDGRGRIIDEATGEYESYDLSASEAEGTPLDTLEVLDQIVLIKADFASEYGIHLHALPSSALSWWDFLDYLNGLMFANTRLARHFAPRDEPDEQPPSD
jgi:hypothetical protein